MNHVCCKGKKHEIQGLERSWSIKSAPVWAAIVKFSTDGTLVCAPAHLMSLYSAATAMGLRSLAKATLAAINDVYHSNPNEWKAMLAPKRLIHR